MIDASAAVLPPMFRSANAEVRVSEESGTTVVAVDGEMDLPSAEGLHDKLRGRATRPSGRGLVGLGHDTFMDTAGLRALVVARSRMDAAGRWLVTRGAAGQPRRLLDIGRVKCGLTL